jgi:CBS domain containing-hemolysin-like protein
VSPYILAFSGPPVPDLQIDPWAGLAFGILLVFINGFFVAAEFALVKVRPTQIDPYVKRGDRRGLVARHMIRHLDAYLSATQLGITLASLALGWIGEPAFAWLVEPLVMKIPGASPAVVHSVALTMAFIVITILHIVLGELAPKSLAIRKPKRTSLWVAIPLWFFFKLTYPAIWVLNHTANAILRIFDIEPVSESQMGHDEEELRRLLASPENSRLSKEKRRILDNVFAFSSRPVRKIMVPRADVVYLSTTEPMQESIAVARRSGHTRLPLTSGGLDSILGFVHIKDLFRSDPLPDQLETVCREIEFVPETLTLDRLLHRMRTKSVHLAAVLDEYGGVSGIVTLENVLEEIVGEIQDEFDFERPELLPRGPGMYEVAGTMLVEDLEQALGIEFSERDEDTVAGVVLSELGRNARAGDTVLLPPLRLEVVKVHGNRIRALNVSITQPSESRPQR